MIITVLIDQKIDAFLYLTLDKCSFDCEDSGPNTVSTPDARGATQQKTVQFIIISDAR